MKANYLTDDVVRTASNVLCTPRGLIVTAPVNGRHCRVLVTREQLARCCNPRARSVGAFSNIFGRGGIMDRTLNDSWGNTKKERDNIALWAKRAGPRVTADNFQQVLKSAPHKGPAGYATGAHVIALLPHMPRSATQELVRRGVLKKGGRGLFGNIAHNFGQMGRETGKAIRKGGAVLSEGAKLLTDNPVWDIAQTGISFIPGVGTAVSAGMSAAAAIGRGESLKDIAIAGVRGAVPGGPVVEAAFDVGVGVLTGEPLDEAAISAIREQVPGGAAGRAAFDAARATVEGQPLPQAALKALPGLANAAAPAVTRALPKVPSIPRLPGGLRVPLPIKTLPRKLPPTRPRGPFVPIPGVPGGLRLPPRVNLPRAPVARAPIGRAFRSAVVPSRAPNQKAMTLAKNLRTDAARGLQAARSFQRGNRSPANVATMARGVQAHQATAGIVSLATAGDPRAQRVVSALGRWG